MNSPRSPEQIRFRRHVEMLVVAFGVVLLAFLLRVKAEGKVALNVLPDFPLPPLCLSYEWFGVKCPGCGLTRSLIHLAHGNWEASYQANRVGWVMAAAVLLQFPYRILSLRRNERPLLGTAVPRLFGYWLIVLLVANWLADSLLLPR
jgi:hypothetical protein